MSKSLEDAIQAAGSPVKLLQTSASRADVGPLTGAEFTNWRDEQTAWRQSAALFNLSHHMTDLNVSGPDAIRLFSEVGINSLANLTVGKAKQLVATNEDGQVIGDGILDYVSKDRLNFAAAPPVVDWVQFHAETGGYDITFARDEPTASNPLHHPEIYRYQINGPTALEILDKINGRPVPPIKFFNAAQVNVGDHHVRALGHTMSRARGVELTGPWAESQQVLDVILEAGREFGLSLTGSKAPLPGTLESGWFPAPLPAIYTGEPMKAYREWLPATSFEATSSLGGSLYSDDITTYYLNPNEIGYTRLIKFDHDFIGRDALQQMVGTPQRKKVTLVWNTDDVMRVIASGFAKGTPFKAMDLPFISYSTFQYDKVLASGVLVGASTTAGYTYNERQMLSLAVVNADVQDGSEVTVVWGEENGGAGKPQVEFHVQTEIRAVVAGVPYSEVDNK